MDLKPCPHCGQTIGGRYAHDCPGNRPISTQGCMIIFLLVIVGALLIGLLIERANADSWQEVFQKEFAKEKVTPAAVFADYWQEKTIIWRIVAGLGCLLWASVWLLNFASVGTAIKKGEGGVVTALLKATAAYILFGLFPTAIIRAIILSF